MKGLLFVPSPTPFELARSQNSTLERGAQSSVHQGGWAGSRGGQEGVRQASGRRQEGVRRGQGRTCWPAGGPSCRPR
eukprot:139856-Prorocentrum_minimum.AAC.3